MMIKKIMKGSGHFMWWNFPASATRIAYSSQVRILSSNESLTLTVQSSLVSSSLAANRITPVSRRAPPVSPHSCLIQVKG